MGRTRATAGYADKVAPAVPRAPVSTLAPVHMLLLRCQATGGNRMAQRLLEPGAPVAGDLVARVVGSRGAPLDRAVRDDMEGRFGHDFSQVRVHTDSRAQESAAAVGARAYTVGSDIVFGQGTYDPAAGAGKLLLAHELTHVVQQQAGAVTGTDVAGGVAVSHPGDRFEREAAQVAARVVEQPTGAVAVTAPDAPMVQRCGDIPPDECACHRPVVQRDELQPGDTAPQDAVDIAAGGRARSNLIFGRQCEPHTTRIEAYYEQGRLLVLVPQVVYVLVGGPAAGDVAAIWRRYLNGTGGLETHDGVADPADRIAQAFRLNELHAPAEDAILAQVQSHIPGLLPRLAGQPSLRLSLDDLGIGSSLRDVAPNYDSQPYTVPGNLAGGIGTSDFGVDSRHIDGQVDFEKVVDPNNPLWCNIRVRAEFQWTVRDGIDF